MAITTSDAVEKKRLEIISYLKKIIKTMNDGDKLPSENTIATRFEANRNTVRSALLSLKVQGLIYSQKGKGFFVIKQPAKFLIRQNPELGMSEILDQANMKYEIKVLNITKRPATNRELALLKLSENENVFLLEHLRYLDGTAFALCYSILPEKLVPDLDIKIKTGKYSFSGTVNLFRDVYGYDHPNCIKTCIQSFPPAQKDMNILSIPDNIPILQQESLYEIEPGIPIEYFIVKGRSDLYKINFTY